MITKKELSKELNVSLPTINRLMDKGMPYLKIGKAVRFELEDVKNWLKEKK